MLYLAASSGCKATIAEIATAFGISEHHLVKVVHFLGKQGWIATIRGKGGGMTLVMQPKDICLGQLVRDTEGALQTAATRTWWPAASARPRPWSSCRR